MSPHVSRRRVVSAFALVPVAGLLAACAEPESEKRLIRLLREIRPRVVYCPHDGEAHPDHRAAADLTRRAVHKSLWRVLDGLGPALDIRPELLLYEVWTPLAEFNVIQDVTVEMETKLAALNEYPSQMGDIRYTDAVRGLNLYRGAMAAGAKYAEVFQAERLVGFV